jgi:hypothetical protein
VTIFVSLLKATGGPGSIPFLILAILLGLGVIYVWPKRRRLGTLWIVAVSVAYLILALPVVSTAIAGRLPGIASAAGIQRPFSTLIILDGDNRRGRARLAQDIVAADRPGVIWVLGDEWIIDPLREAGVAEHLFRYDGTAATTLEQIHQVRRIASEAPGRTALIASRLQAPRVAALIDVFAIPAAVVAAPVDAEPPTSGVWRFIPRYIALRVSRDALYEHAALWWYARQGRIRSPQPTER